ESVRKVACNHKKELLARSLEMCLNIGVSQVQPPYKEVDQVKLEQLKVLNVRVECGSGGFYKVNKSQQTYCTLHEAASDW
ncbi:MAG: hypothetical protein QGH40_00175, partial [bacterium]|nr:hypothetical protein [bacterium]